jgi:hypothetical protein
MAQQHLFCQGATIPASHAQRLGVFVSSGYFVLK